MKSILQTFFKGRDVKCCRPKALSVARTAPNTNYVISLLVMRFSVFVRGCTRSCAICTFILHYIILYYVMCIETGDKLSTYCCAWSPEPNRSRLSIVFFYLFIYLFIFVTVAALRNVVVFIFVENRT